MFHQRHLKVIGLGNVTGGVFRLWWFSVFISIFWALRIPIAKLLNWVKHFSELYDHQSFFFFFLFLHLTANIPTNYCPTDDGPGSTVAERKEKRRDLRDRVSCILEQILWWGSVLSSLVFAILGNYTTSHLSSSERNRSYICHGDNL